jgi:LuxR family transcriptional regulator, maltose regulon positive regulatory protein
MQLICNASKLTLPLLPTVITRDRLARRIRTCHANGLILLLGQAAQGKTTLAADLLRHIAAPTAWLSIDREDAEPLRFYNLLIQALSRAIPSIDVSACFETERSVTVPGRPAELLRPFQARWPRLAEEVQIVLDGLERLPDQAPAFEMIRQLCNTPGPFGHIWILSRHKPPFAHQQAIINRQMLVLNNDDLAFTPREVAIYFEAVHQFNLPPTSIDTVHQVTEGWPGGLVLLAQALERTPPSRWKEYLSCDLPSRLGNEARHYFSEEVFSRFPAHTRLLLCHAAMPESIDEAMLEAISGLPDCGNQLIQLVQSHAFIRSCYDSRRGVVHYRFNPLFREFLRAEFKAALTPAEQKAFYARMAAFYDARNEVATAIKWYFQGDDYDRAAAGLKRIGTDLVIRGRFSELAEQIHPFPEDQCQTDPWLFFLRTLTGRMRAGPKCLADFESALVRFNSHNDVRGQMLALAHLIEAGILLGQTPAVYLHWVEKAEKWLAQQSATPYYAWAKTLLWLNIGFGYIVGGLDLTKGLSAAQNAMLLARKMKNAVLMARAEIISGLGLATAGELEEADEMLSRISPNLTAESLAEYGVLLAMVHVELAIRRGHFAAARQLTKSLGRDIEAYGLLYLYPAYLEACGYLQIYQGEYAEAQATCRYLLDVALMAGNPVYKGLSHRLSSLIHYYQSNYPQSAAEAHKALAELDSAGPSTVNVMRSRQLLALASLHLEEYAAAEPILNQVLLFFQQSANPLALAETYLIYGLWADATGQAGVAEHHLRSAFHIMTRHHIDRLYLMGPYDRDRISRLGAGFRIAMPENWRGRAATGREDAQASVTAVCNPPLDLSAAPEPALVIRTFGGFSVLRNGITPIDEEEWGGQRPKLLLKAILVRGLREIPKDLLMDDLWPESTPQTAIQNFKVTLHRLRKILEPGLSKGTGSAYIHLRGNLVSLDRHCCRVDLEQFLIACKEIRRCTLVGEGDSITALGRSIMALYQGDFLPEEPYAPWIEMKRWALRDEYIDVLLKMARMYHQKKESEAAADCCRTILRIDSCYETAAQLLIQLYSAQGRCNEARQVYAHLDQALRSELGVPPDPATAALIKKVEARE